ncbi:MAG: hypothetical protein ACI379_13810, partial [Nocardioides sp.]|uniref:hypothetical protein n=1 Tax=Nocardioides sp. TaxID=35761 RepID=UPI003F0A6644
ISRLILAGDPGAVEALRRGRREQREVRRAEQRRLQEADLLVRRRARAEADHARAQQTAARRQAQQAAQEYAHRVGLAHAMITAPQRTVLSVLQARVEQLREAG